jgi:FkbM family methyltransferase
MSTALTELFDSSKQRLVHLGNAVRRTIGTAEKIETGPGKGLRFDAGPDTHRFSTGQYERPVQEAIAAVVRPGNVCYDIGANVGFFSIVLSRLAGPTGSVYAFEPVPRNVSAIEQNARLNRLGNITVLKVALASVDGESELLLAHHIGGAMLKSAGAPPDLAGRLDVRTAALDTLSKWGSVKPPHFVKIDVEGAEIDVLQGMTAILKKWAPAIMLELDDEDMTACDNKVARCVSLLCRFGYRAEALPKSYPDSRWFVRHIIATRTL